MGTSPCPLCVTYTMVLVLITSQRETRRAQTLAAGTFQEINDLNGSPPLDTGDELGRNNIRRKVYPRHQGLS